MQVTFTLCSTEKYILRTIVLLTVGIMGLQVSCSAEYLQEIPDGEIGPEPVRQVRREKDLSNCTEILLKIASYLLNKRSPPESAGSQ